MTTDDRRAAVLAAAVAYQVAVTALRYADASYPLYERHVLMKAVWDAQEAILEAVAAMQAAERAALARMGKQ